jgi:hypothetical protein
MIVLVFAPSGIAICLARSSTRRKRLLWVPVSPCRGRSRQTIATPHPKSLVLDGPSRRLVGCRCELSNCFSYNVSRYVPFSISITTRDACRGKEMHDAGRSAQPQNFVLRHVGKKLEDYRLVANIQATHKFQNSLFSSAPVNLRERSRVSRKCPTVLQRYRHLLLCCLSPRKTVFRYFQLVAILYPNLVPP